MLAVLQNCIVALGFFGHVQGGPTLRRDGLGSVSLPENSLHMNFRRDDVILHILARARHDLPGKSASAVRVRQPPAAVKGARATPGPELHRSLPSVGAYQVRGCYAEPAGGARSLPCLLDAADMTVESRIAAVSAAGARYAGLQYSRECWCGNTLAGGSLLASTDNCVTMTCRGSC
ncbi:hypothetical protein MCOR15_002735 [Pyricularia oryzae]|nr:hypothetical protein MCOR15_002735 [Pyricularia oryzae]